MFLIICVGEVKLGWQTGTVYVPHAWYWFLYIPGEKLCFFKISIYFKLYVAFLTWPKFISKWLNPPELHVPLRLTKWLSGWENMDLCLGKGHGSGPQADLFHLWTWARWLGMKKHVPNPQLHAMWIQVEKRVLKEMRISSEVSTSSKKLNHVSLT